MWELDSERPVYIQLIEKLKADIISGYYKAGDKLPSVRDLAAQALVNPNTMQKALSELERTGLIYTNRTAGRFITSDESIIRKLKEEAAALQVREFINSMKQLGYEPEQIIELVTRLLKVEGNQD
ncbi:MAG: GntR family transcriptional regulator [Clostridiales bacterium]|nr:GntR family transcriptional regulator [Clostridiales bacterium]